MDIGTGLTVCGVIAGGLLAIGRFVPSNKVSKDVCIERHKSIDDKLDSIGEKLSKIFNILDERK